MSGAGAVGTSVRLRTGRSAAVRAAFPADEPPVADFLAGLSTESVTMPFRSSPPALVRAQARAVCDPSADGAGLIALAIDDGREAVVGVARYNRRRRAPAGEFSLAVADRWQGQGLGRGLFEVLAASARDAGLDELWCMVRAGNAPMLGMLSGLGAEHFATAEGDLVRVRIPVVPDDAWEAAATERYAQAAAASLEPMFRPRSIAVVGASRRAGAPGGAVFRALRRGFDGPVVPVNPGAAEVDGVAAYPSLRDAPGPLDMAVVAVPARLVPGVARDAAEAGVRALVVISSGFGEAGEEGRALDAELVQIARTAGIRVLGPNCLGLAVNDPEHAYNATFGPAAPPPGRMAFASQSGGLGVAALAYCTARGIGLSAFASLGNKSDITSKDLLAWWDRDPGTRVILLYLEGFGEPRRFARLARQVVGRTPVVAIKSGRGDAGRRGASSHTASLAAGDASTDTLLDAAGVVRVDTMEELFETGQLLADQPLPAGMRVAVLSNAGGPGIIAADACEGHGLLVPELSDGLQAAVRAAAPGVAGSANPVDLGSAGDAAGFAAAGRHIVASGEVDAVVVIYTPIAGADTEAILGAAHDIADGRVTVVGSVADGVPRHPPAGQANPVPFYPFPESAVRALAHAARAGRVRRRAADPAPPPDEARAARGRRALWTAHPGGWLAPEAVDDLLEAYGIRAARARVVRSPEEAAELQAAWGVPVAVKLVSDTLTHKSDVGGVVLGVDGPGAAASAYRAIARNVAAAGHDGAMAGALVQEQAGEGVDMLVGAVCDPVFGPLVVAGLGGVQAELWRDRSLALAPVGRAESLAMLARLRSARLLAGWRGAPPADVSALGDVITRVGRLAADQPALAELDLNPVRVMPEGHGVLVLDARVRRREARAAG